MARTFPGWLTSHVSELWRSLRRAARPAPKRLRLCESLALGERRFVAVVEFEKERFLVGGTASSLALLARLPDTHEGGENRAQSRVNALWSGGSTAARGDEPC